MGVPTLIGKEPSKRPTKNYRMKPSVTILGFFVLGLFGLVGCAGISGSIERTEPIRTPDYQGYPFLIKISVVRPSDRDTSELTASSMKMLRKYGIVNRVAYLDGDRITSRSGSSIKDSTWLEHFKSDGLVSGNAGWNYDPNTIAHVLLSRGPNHTGEIIFMKNGQRLGGKRITGGRNLYDYYIAMEKLGIYIP